jgi:dUTP pyrophosphatase
VTLNVRITRLHDHVALPAYQTTGAAGFDLAASVAMTVQPGEVTLVPTGLVIEVPAGHLLGVFARSSTPLKRGLMVANGVGVVESDYCGPEDEVKIAVINLKPEPVAIEPGDRIAQGILLPAPRVTWEEVNRVRPTSRGGFGATG